MGKKERFAYIFAIIGLAILLAVSITLGVSGWYYSISNQNGSDSSANSSILIDMNGTGAETTAITFSGKVLNGEKIYRNINLKNVGEKDLYIRAKAEVHTFKDGNKPILLGITENWSELNGYYYYTTSLQSGASIGLASYVKIDEEYRFESSKNYIINVVIESLDKNLDVMNIWNVDIYT